MTVLSTQLPRVPYTGTADEAELEHWRGIAQKIADQLSADALVRAVRGADKAVITGARLFDRYDGDQGLSLAVEVTLQPGDKSFTEAEISAISAKIIAAAAKVGAALRS